MIRESLSKVVEGKDLTFDEMRETFGEIMSGETTGAQMAALLTALRMKGETIDEITACATVMREKGLHIDTDGMDVLEIVGTGGDGAQTINISTISSFVIAAGGVKVGKHGNRSASSKCGAADCLEALGVKLDLPPEKNAELLKKIGICFMFAQTYHTSMKYAGPVRKQIGIRTIFNILGPLANPAAANLQLLGVYDENLVVPLAEVLIKLGIKRAMVVHGHDGLDEATICDTTTVCEINNNKTSSFFLSPEQLGLKRAHIGDLKGGTPEENAQIALAILKGEERGAKRDAVVLNSALCLYMGNSDVTLKQCVKMAEELIDSGKALEKLNELIKYSNEV
ncbi:MAG: anthranilate phosphoribosyltransferase [Clostridia bacterium]|nr:anthranilate phosphoribosyltransferase [Clostridia bacterium]